MLILMRRIGERLMVGDNVAIEILKINGRQVHLGITAPKDINIHREEVYQHLTDKQKPNNEKNQMEKKRA